MPNHLHAIIIINNSVGAYCHTPANRKQTTNTGLCNKPLLLIRVFLTTLPLTTGFFTKKLLAPPLFPRIPNYLVFNFQKFLLKNAKKIFRRNK